jgi:hypothetical protein
MTQGEVAGQVGIYLLLSLQESLYGKPSTSISTIEAFKHGLRSLGLGKLLEAVDADLVRSALADRSGQSRGNGSDGARREGWLYL